MFLEKDGAERHRPPQAPCLCGCSDIFPSIPFVGSFSLFIWSFLTCSYPCFQSDFFPTVWHQWHTKYTWAYLTHAIYTSTWSCPFFSRTLALRNKTQVAFLYQLQSSILFVFRNKTCQIQRLPPTQCQLLFVDCSWHRNSKKLSSNIVVFKISSKLHWLLSGRRR